MKIGIDIGGTTTKVGYFEKEKVCIFKKYVTNSFPLIELLFKQIYDDLILRHIEISKVSICCPNYSSSEDRVINPPNLFFKDLEVEISSLCQQVFKVDTVVENDANARAFAEINSYEDDHHLICLSFGTGLGSGIISHSQLIKGCRSFASEVGHMYFGNHELLKNLKCSCGEYGHLEALFSEKGLVRYFCEKFNQDFKSTLEVYDYLKNSDHDSDNNFTELNEILSQLLSFLIALFEPRDIVFTGGVSRLLGLGIDELITMTKEKSFKSMYFPEIRESLLDSDLGAIKGALNLP